jgi:hypothetical protein
MKSYWKWPRARRYLLLCALGGGACDRSPAAPPDVPDPPLPDDCAHVGGIVHASGGTMAVWKAADGPHRLKNTVTIQDLTIEPGTLICGAAGARLVVGSLVAIGTDELPIRFTSETPGLPWDGIEAHTLTVTNATIENATAAVRAYYPTLERSTIRNIRGRAIFQLAPGEGRIVDTVIDSACTTDCGGIAGPAAVFVQGPRFHFENSSIRDSGAGGILVLWRSSVSLLGVRIEGSQGIGLELREDTGRPLHLIEGHDVRITGGATYPARLPVSAAAALLSSAGAVQAWTGNAADTVLVTAMVAAPDLEVTIHPGLVWHIGWGPAGGSVRIRNLQLEPGASLLLDASTTTGLNVATITARGSPEAPVTITAEVSNSSPTFQNWLRLEGTAADTSRLEHTHLMSTRLRAGGAGPLVLEHVKARRTELLVLANGSKLGRVQFAESHPLAVSILSIAASDVQLSDCVVTGSAGHGIITEVVQGVTITHCNIFDNIGPGVRNAASGSLLARDNWWGDADGPFGLHGDGIEGNVSFMPFRTQPLQFGPAPETRASGR